MMQLDIDELEQFQPVRISGVERSLLRGLSEAGPVALVLTGEQRAGDFGVGDWVLATDDGRIIRRLDPISSLTRRAAGTDRALQIIASNLNTLFIVTSANADFNPARLERYLALAAEAEVTPVLVITKADLVEDVSDYVGRAQSLMPDLHVVALDAVAGDVDGVLGPWCGSGQTVALVGSSGVGKTTVCPEPHHGPRIFSLRPDWQIPTAKAPRRTTTSPDRPPEQDRVPERRFQRGRRIS